MKIGCLVSGLCWNRCATNEEFKLISSSLLRKRFCRFHNETMTKDLFYVFWR